VKAVISLKPGFSTTPEEIKAFARAHMAAYKYPRSVEIIDDLPKTTSGKILRRLLQSRPGSAARPQLTPPHPAPSRVRRGEAALQIAL
jgi:acyl-CoA synthetase (AMP-forming)/AMP-acid ligase II